MTINLSACPITAGGGATASRTYGDRWADIINVKDYGAVGDGSHNDGPAIQAAFDAAYGPRSAPNSAPSVNVTNRNKSVYFPAGTYLTNQQLFLSRIQGAHVFGDGQRATTIKYGGSATNLPRGTITTLLNCCSLDYSHFQGITFDCTGSNATVGVQLMGYFANATGAISGGTTLTLSATDAPIESGMGVYWSGMVDPSHPPVTNTGSGLSWTTFSNVNGNVASTTMFIMLNADGTGNKWEDCGFIGCVTPAAGGDGFLCTLDGSGATGSEQLFVGCTFANSNRGAMIVSGNALNYSFVGCQFSNLMYGIWCPNGSFNLVKGCSFNNPSYASFNATFSGTAMTVNSGLVGTIQIGQTVCDGAAAHVSYHTTIVSGSGTSWVVSNPIFSTTDVVCTGIDIFCQQTQCPAVVGCISVSPNFCLSGPVWIAGCYHNPPVPGGIWNGRFDHADNPLHAVIEGCLGGANSGIYGYSDAFVYLRGNTFLNAGYNNMTVSFQENI